MTVTGTAAGGGGKGDRARRRLAHWRETHDQHHRGRLAARLAHLGIDEPRLLALLAEDRAALAGRTEKPAWASTAENVLARMSDEPADGTGTSWSSYDGFAAIVSPFTDLARDQLHAGSASRVTHVDHTAVVETVVRTLTGILVWLAARTLVLELNVLRVTQRLEGDTPERRFASFVRHFTRRDGLAVLLDEYPVLARLLVQAAEQTVDAHHELLSRFADDRAMIVAQLLDGVDPGALVEIRTGSGDRHEQGRSVAVLRFAGGAQVVYKPRPLAVHSVFNDVLTWFDAKLPGTELRRVRLLDRGRYGWLEFVDHLPCSTAGAPERYYHRLGVLLAILYAIDGCDMHGENLIACADQPVLIDLETQFHPPLPAPGPDRDDPARRTVDASVVRVGLLPWVMWNADGALDISGIGSDAGQRSPFPSAGWAAAGTDEMHLVRRFASTMAGHNRPSLDGVPAEPQEYLPQLLAGFRAGYTTIETHRHELTGPDGLLRQFGDVDVRVILRPTRVYTNLLAESTHPDVMRDALDREQAFGVLWATAPDAGCPDDVVSAEVEQLWSDDVPILLGRPGSADVRCGTSSQPGFWPVTPLDRIVDKLRTMGPSDRQTQEWIVRATMATRRSDDRDPGASGHGEGQAGPPLSVGHGDTGSVDPGQLLGAARRIAENVLAAAHTEGDRIGWLGLRDLTGAGGSTWWTVAPSGTGLYDGRPGIALFLAQLAALTGEDRYATAATRALWAIPRLLDEPATVDGRTCGAFDGLAGVAYVVTHVAALLDDATLLRWVPPLVAATAATMDTDGDLGVHADVISGAAGCLAAMLAVHQATGLTPAWDTARRCADRLLAGADAVGQPGFAHGSAGIGWALLRFTAAGGGQRYADAGLAALTRARTQQEHDQPVSWCRGTCGIAHAAADSTAYTSDPEVARDLDQAIDSMLAAPTPVNHSLCHGQAGIIEALTTAMAAGRRDLAGARRTRVRRLLADLDTTGPRCGTHSTVPTSGLMTGQAGIGYVLLRLAFTDQVPCVLLLEASTTGGNLQRQGDLA